MTQRFNFRLIFQRKTNTRERRPLSTNTRGVLHRVAKKEEEDAEPLNCFTFDHHLPPKNPLPNPQIHIQWH